MENIKNSNISLTNSFSEYYFDDVIWAIKEKFHQQPDKSFEVFIEPINEILHKIARADIPTIYEEDDWLEIRQECQQLRAEILALDNTSL